MFKTILLHKLCDLDHKVVLLRWSDRGTSLWERYMSGSIDETTFMCAAENETIDRALSGLVFWRSGVNNGKQFLCASEWSTYLVCYKTSLIYKAPYLGVFQPIIHLKSTRTYLMWFRSGTIDKAPLWCA